MKGILFKAVMVRAVLDEFKTQTRRLQKSVSDKPRYKVGEIVYVKETFAIHLCHIGGEDKEIVLYLSDGECCEHCGEHILKCRPAIHLPERWSRIWLEITDVRLQRLQDISEQDALAEGITWPALEDGTAFRPPSDPTGLSTVRPYAERYFELWDSINTEHKADTNPPVFVYTFKRVERPNGL